VESTSCSPRARPPPPWKTLRVFHEPLGKRCAFSTPPTAPAAAVGRKGLRRRGWEINHPIPISHRPEADPIPDIRPARSRPDPGHPTGPKPTRSRTSDRAEADPTPGIRPGPKPPRSRTSDPTLDQPAAAALRWRVWKRRSLFQAAREEREAFFKVARGRARGKGEAFSTAVHSHRQPRHSPPRHSPPRPRTSAKKNRHQPENNPGQLFGPIRHAGAERPQNQGSQPPPCTQHV